MQITINTARAVTPKIYAYTTPEIARHDGWTKIGYTEQDVITRIKQQSHTVDVLYQLEWQDDAIFDDGSFEKFSDKDFHKYLRKLNVEQKSGTEWFKISGTASKKCFRDFRANRGILNGTFSVTPYNLREEQELAVEMTLKYFREHAGGNFLWNAKPRFGKTLAVYDFCRRAGAQNVLIVTNRPAIANSWYDDYEKFFGNAEYLFVSRVDALRGKKFVMTREEFFTEIMNRDDAKCIEFVSLQDMKSSRYFNAESEIDKLREVAEMNWDILVVDEAHEGVDTFKTDVAFDQIKRKFTLHLSGTPFKALASKKFPAEAIFNWTYGDEQQKKISWDGEDENPYAELPQLNLYTYQMSEIVADELKRGVEINGETVEYAFDLNEFFATKDGKFIHESSVDKFLDALTKQKKFPFSTPELRNELRHTFWLLDRVASARALAKKLADHPVFGSYEVILAAGDGKLDDDAETKRSFDAVTEAIARNEPANGRTITLSVGQLTTGVTIPEWTGVLMLANVHSPALYIQAAFRAQNPCLFQRGKKFLRKENAYVFDFDPARTLNIYETFANDLASSSPENLEARQKNIRELLNFFPVIGEDEHGELIELDAEKVLTIPRKIRSVEVVRRGFMSDFLFQNIFHVFNAPPEVIKILEEIPPVTESEIEIPLPEKVERTKGKIFLDDAGEVKLPQKHVIDTTQEIFGDKVFETRPESTAAQKVNTVVKQVMTVTDETYGDVLSKSEQKTLERQLKNEVTAQVEREKEKNRIELNNIERDRNEALQQIQTSDRTREEIKAERKEVNAKFDKRKREANEKHQATENQILDDFAKSAPERVIEVGETKKQERERDSVTDEVRDHLRGFARTIPSFLMAYGDEKTTLATFDTIIPDEVFREVTSISLEQFRYLRDVGKLFDPVVFDDAVQEFLRLREELADYFDEGHDEDIFDYIPPQRTNQIFTPKETVQHMADMLERENPGCFDDPNKKFIDPYMKSGLFVAEFVKRLYRSPALKKIFPDKAERLRHIFAEQVYGLAPTKIIYLIANKYILGFGIEIPRNNLREANAVSAAVNDELEKFFDELFTR